MVRATRVKKTSRSELLWTPLRPEEVHALAQVPTAEELARRKVVLARFQQLWNSASLVDVDPSDFLREAREEDQASGNG